MPVQAAAITGNYADRVAEPSVREADQFANPMEEIYDSIESGKKCAKGILTSIGLELGVALAFYGLWQAWHLFR